MPKFGSRSVGIQPAVVIVLVPSPNCPFEQLPSTAMRYRSFQVFPWTLYRVLSRSNAHRTSQGRLDPPSCVACFPRAPFARISSLGEFARSSCSFSCYRFCFWCIVAPGSCSSTSSTLFQQWGRCRASACHRPATAQRQIKPRPSIGRSTVQNIWYRFGASFAKELPIYLNIKPAVQSTFVKYALCFWRRKVYRLDSKYVF